MPRLAAGMRRSTTPRRFFADAAKTETPVTETDNAMLMKYVGGVVGLCVLQRMWPEKKQATSVHTHPNADKYKLSMDNLPKTGSTPTAANAEAPAAPVVAPATSEHLPASAEARIEELESKVAAIINSGAVGGPAECLDTAPPTAPTNAKLLGTSADWAIFMQHGSLFAASRASALRLTPEGVRVGAVVIGSGELLAELDGYSPSFTGTASLHRIVLPSAHEPDAPAPDAVPDTEAPGSEGSTVLAWLTSGTPLVARGALVQPARGDGGAALYIRSQEPARVGDQKWLATCKRLGLPDPPIDPLGPPIFSEWKCVATWSKVAAEEIDAVGFEAERAWVRDTAKMTSTGYAIDGSTTSLPLS
jgi:hypothetical protein